MSNDDAVTKFYSSAPALDTVLRVAGIMYELALLQAVRKVESVYLVLNHLADIIEKHLARYLEHYTINNQPPPP